MFFIISKELSVVENCLRPEGAPVKFGNTILANIMFEVKIKTPEQRQWRRSGVFIVNFEHISQLFLVFLLLTWTSKCQLGY